jgi:hypothetical protein
MIMNTPNKLQRKRANSKVPRNHSKKRSLSYAPDDEVEKSLQRNDQEIPEIENNLQENVQNLEVSSLGYTQIFQGSNLGMIDDVLMQDMSAIPQIDQLEAAAMPSMIQNEITNNLQMDQNPEISQMNQNDAAEIPQSPSVRVEEVQPSELILDEIQETSKVLKRSKKHKLIVDKNPKIEKLIIAKNFDDYAAKFTILPPRDTFPMRWLELKISEAVIFASPSPRLKHSDVLRDLFDRNLKKVQPRGNKRKHVEVAKENDKENEIVPNMKRRKSLRNNKNALKDCNGENLINTTYVVPEIPELDIPQYTPDIQNELQIPQIEELELPPVNNETCKVRRRINIEHDG